MFLNVRFFQGRCQCNLLLFCVSIQSKQKHNTSKHIKTIQIFTNPSSLNMTWVSVSGKLLKVLMRLVFVNGLLNSGPQLCLSHLTFKWHLTNGSHRDGYQTKGDPSTPSWVHWKKEGLLDWLQAITQPQRMFYYLMSLVKASTTFVLQLLKRMSINMSGWLMIWLVQISYQIMLVLSLQRKIKNLLTYMTYFHFKHKLNKNQLFF